MENILNVEEKIRRKAMNKGLNALVRYSYNPTVDDFNEIKRELERLEEIDNGAYVPIHINRYNELCDKEKVFEILTKYAYNTTSLISLITMMRFWEEDGKTITKELLEKYDFPYTVEEYYILKKVLL